jgi:hypothetical protein
MRSTARVLLAASMVLLFAYGGDDEQDTIERDLLMERMVGAETSSTIRSWDGGRR